MVKPHNQVSNCEVRSFWERHPVAAEGIDAPPGTTEFFEHFDKIREEDDCEPYDFSNMIHGYSQSSKKQILDVGCGNGYVLSRYAAQGANVFGVDISETAVHLSKKRFELFGLRGLFKITNGESLDFLSDQFDIVCSMGVLHHIENPQPMIKEIYRVLKPGGKAIVMLYYRYSWKYFVILRLKRLFLTRYRGKSQQEALNMNDGTDCPLALVYNKTQARQLLSQFQDHKFRLNQLSWKQLFLIPALSSLLEPILPSCSNNYFARQMGWNMYIEAIKPSPDL